MRAAQVVTTTGPADVEVRDVDEPTPGPDDVLVEVWHDVTPGADHYFLTEDPVRARVTMGRVAVEVGAALSRTP